METYNDTLTGNLKRNIDELSTQIDILRNENQRIKDDYARDVEHVRLILLDALSTDQRDYVDVDILANSIADVFAISLLKTVRVAFTVDVEADVLVPAGFDISELSIENLQVDAWNSEVEELSVQSFDVGTIEEI